MEQVDPETRDVSPLPPARHLETGNRNASKGRQTGLLYVFTEPN